MYFYSAIKIYMAKIQLTIGTFLIFLIFILGGCILAHQNYND